MNIKRSKRSKLGEKFNNFASQMGTANTEGSVNDPSV